MLETFVDIRNDTCRDALLDDAKGLWSTFGGVRIKDIDFDGLLDAYFADLDFLFDPKVLDGLTEAGREMLGLKEQVFGVVNRLPPHPEELQLLECEPPDSSDRPLFRAGEDYPRFTAE